MNRIVVIGSSCSGKSTFSRSLAAQKKVQYIELDQLHWLPDWEKRPVDEFRDLVSKALTSDAWVVDGNYSVARDIIWSRATQIIWLNHSFKLVLYRAINRSMKRALTRERLFAGNVESIKQTLFSRKSMIWWVIKTYHQKRKHYSTALKDSEASGKTVIEFNNQLEVDNYFKRL